MTKNRLVALFIPFGGCMSVWMWLLGGWLLLGTACAEEKANHFITDDGERERVEADFRKKQEAVRNESLFAMAIDSTVAAPEQEALRFLYAYMPLGDVADYDGRFWLENVRAAFRAQQEMPWGKKVPERIFRHFVLPVRVNNEALDSSRMVFYEELRQRVRRLTLGEAALEVNHWCHEKVIYAPSDGRTSAALASVRSAYGRCGEESTFTVAALRAVGIPARQVYTPRWAHTDDNHAWVEVWVDGKWHFMGACEPEAVLDLGWFNAPAMRGMLMHTRVFGRYSEEEVVRETEVFTEVNVTEHYAPTAAVCVRITDAEGQAVAGAEVEFKLYNYAEFYTVADMVTDSAGECHFSAGKGDMLVWATKDGLLGYAKVSFGKDERMTVRLDKKQGMTAAIELDIVPPPIGTVAVTVAEEQKAKNAQRMLEEDSLRDNYTATFYTLEQAAALANELGTDLAQTTRLMQGSRGNHAEIERFLRETPVADRKTAMQLLGLISAKDLRDTPADVLRDHLNHAPQTDSDLFAHYVLNPRIANELLTAYKSELTDLTDSVTLPAIRRSPHLLTEWVRQHISLRNDLNPQRIPVSPAGVITLGAADALSRDVFFVAAARTAGVPARLHPVDRRVQYHNGKQWKDVAFEPSATINPPQGKLVTTFTPTHSITDPKYHTHFTVARILPDGKLQTLALNRSVRNVDMGAGDTWSSLLKEPLDMDAGHYVLVTGARMATGDVLSNVTFFNIEAGKTTQLPLVMRESGTQVSVLGSFSSESRFHSAETGEETSILATTGRGYYILGLIVPGQEPTNHALRDIAAVREALQAYPTTMLLLFPNEAASRNFNTTPYGEMPNTVRYGVDIDGKLRRAIAEAMLLPQPTDLPLFIIADTFDRVVFVSHGYTIGMGEQLLSVLRKL